MHTYIYIYMYMSIIIIIISIIMVAITMINTSWPLYGGGSGLHIFRLYVYSFVICCSPLGVFGGHFDFLGVTLASLWLPWDAGGSL